MNSCSWCDCFLILTGNVSCFSQWVQLARLLSSWQEWTGTECRWWKGLHLWTMQVYTARRLPVVLRSQNLQTMCSRDVSCHIWICVGEAFPIYWAVLDSHVHYLTLPYKCIKIANFQSWKCVLFLYIVLVSQYRVFDCSICGERVDPRTKDGVSYYNIGSGIHWTFYISGSFSTTEDAKKIWRSWKFYASAGRSTL